MKFFITPLLCIGLSCILAGCSNGPSSGNTPSEMFEHLIESPVPSSVSNLQGVGDTWQGYAIWLRFTAAPAFANSLQAKGFSPVPCNDIETVFELPADYNVFNPPWNPTMDQCFGGNIMNDWGNGYHAIGINTVSQTVHFYGVAP